MSKAPEFSESSLLVELHQSGLDVWEVILEAERRGHPRREYLDVWEVIRGAGIVPRPSRARERPWSEYEERLLKQIMEGGASWKAASVKMRRGYYGTKNHGIAMGIRSNSRSLADRRLLEAESLPFRGATAQAALCLPWDGSVPFPRTRKAPKGGRSVALL